MGQGPISEPPHLPFAPLASESSYPKLEKPAVPPLNNLSEDFNKSEFIPGCHKTKGLVIIIVGTLIIVGFIVGLVVPNHLRLLTPRLGVGGLEGLTGPVIT